MFVNEKKVNIIFWSIFGGFFAFVYLMLFIDKKRKGDAK